MIHRTPRLALAAALTAALLTAFTATALASGDSGDGFHPAGASFTASSGKMTLQGTVNGINVTMTCTGSSFGGTTPSQTDVWSIPLSPRFTFSGCTVTVGGADSTASIGVSGTWTMTWNDALTSDAEPNIDQAVMGVGGLTISAAALAGCTITWSGSVTGSWDDVTTTTPSKFVFSNAPISVSASGCTASGWTFTATYVTNPGITDT